MVVVVYLYFQHHLVNLIIIKAIIIKAIIIIIYLNVFILNLSFSLNLFLLLSFNFLFLINLVTFSHHCGFYLLPKLGLLNYYQNPLIFIKYSNQNPIQVDHFEVIYYYY